jgi:hypothetical protein
MKTIVVLYHHRDAREGKAFLAELRNKLDLNEYRLWHNDSRTAFGDAYRQMENEIGEARAVLVIVGANGFDEEFEGLSQGAIQQRIVKDNLTFGRLRVQLPGSVEPLSMLARWVSVRSDDSDYRRMAEEVLDRLIIKPRLSVGLALDRGIEQFAETIRPDLRRHFTDVVQELADGKPLTVLIGPYASVEETDNGSCPSRIREALLKLIDDQVLKDTLAPLQAAAAGGLIPPLLWQDHLATLCLLSGCTRGDVTRAIEGALDSVPGDVTGPPDRLFAVIADFVSQLKTFGPRRGAGQPTVTILTVCPGLRMERALISRGQELERVTLIFGNSGPEVHHKKYLPGEEHAERAATGLEHFMPNSAAVSADDVAFTRLIKLAGSRDLDQGIACGDFGQSYDLMGQLHQRLADFVTTAGTGPYLLLGGGVSTPPLQAAHAVLLRSMLERPERRPRLALISPRSGSPDVFRRIEDGRAPRLTRVPNSGFERIQMLLSDPVTFINAMSIAFGAPVEHRAA